MAAQGSIAGGARLFSTSSKPSLEAFSKICSQQATKEQYPLATSIKNNVPIYDLPPYAELTENQRTALQDEWYKVLIEGPGVYVTSGLFRDSNLIDRANEAFAAIIKKEKESATSAGGDHFAGAGSNDRIWNSFSKHCLQDAESFLEYYSNPYLALISSSWLGPGYRITAQVNNVKPGGKPQVSHRDYHLGFQSADSCARFPQAMQVASQLLTLQGAVAHVDVPVESGPTRLLPFSQSFAPGYMAYRLPEFNDFFLENYISLPLKKGDGLFFNPALFHAAGENKSTDVYRAANLLQISSAFGKPMESVDLIPLVEKCWDTLLRRYEAEGLTEEVKCFVAALGEGYPFPTNLDRNSPRNESMSPDSEQDVLMRGLEAKKSREEMLKCLEEFKLATCA